MIEKPFTQQQMAAHLSQSPKTFAKYAIELGIPYIQKGKRRAYDCAKVMAHLSRIPAQPDNVLQFKPTARKSQAQKSKFAVEVGL